MSRLRPEFFSSASKDVIVCAIAPQSCYVVVLTVYSFHYATGGYTYLSAEGQIETFSFAPLQMEERCIRQPDDPAGVHPIPPLDPALFSPFFPSTPVFAPLEDSPLENTSFEELSGIIIEH